MKPKNFPDRKNKRRLVALSHLSTPHYKTKHQKSVGGEVYQNSSEVEERSLQASINPRGRREIRTKQRRGM